MNCFGQNNNFLAINCLFFNCCILTHNKIFVNNLKHPLSVITMKVSHNSFNPFQLFNNNFLSLSCWLRLKSELLLLKEKLKVVNICKYIYGFK